MGTPSAEHDDSMPSQGTGKLRRARGNTAQIGALLRNGIIEISPDPPAEQHTPGPDCDDAEGVPLGRAPSAALKRQRSPELGSNMPMSPSLFPLERAQILTTVAKAIALHIRHDPSFSAPDELAIFDQASVEGPAFDGSEDEIRQLLEAMVNLGLDPNALVVASVFIERLVQLLGSKAELRDGPIIPPSAARAIILTMVLLASKYNFDEGVRMKHVRADSDVCTALGPGLVSRFGKLEERVLTLFNWQLRVTATEYANYYEKLVDSQRSVSNALSIRVMSVPMSLSLLGMEHDAGS